MRQVAQGTDFDAQYVYENDKVGDMTGEELWHRVCARLKAELGAHTFRSWFEPLTFLSLEANCAHIRVPTGFIRDWILAHFEDRLRAFWRMEAPTITRIDLVLPSAEQEPQPNAKPAAMYGSVPAHGEADTRWAPRQRHARSKQGFAEVPTLEPALPSDPSRVAEQQSAEQGKGISARLKSRLTFDNFVVGKSNELAHLAARQIAETPVVHFNPLYIYGGVGLGKTHLLQAIAWEIQTKDPSRTAVYMSAEHFMYQFVRALRDKDMLAFKERLRGVDVLLLDDVRFIANKESTQEEFFHTFNALMEQNRQIVIAADCPPSELEGIEERIQSRLGQGLAADIHAMDFDLRVDILFSKADQVRKLTNSRVDVSREVVHFLAESIVSNVRVLEGALNRIVAHAILVGRPITLAMAKEKLADILKSNVRKITIDEIQRCVASHFKMRQTDLLSPRRSRDIVRPRQIAMYLCKQLTTRSLPEIGRKFGGRDHTTVIHAVRQIDKLRQKDAALDQDVETVKRRLQS